MGENHEGGTYDDGPDETVWVQHIGGGTATYSMPADVAERLHDSVAAQRDEVITFDDAESNRRVAIHTGAIVVLSSAAERGDWTMYAECSAEDLGNYLDGGDAAHDKVRPTTRAGYAIELRVHNELASRPPAWLRKLVADLNAAEVSAEIVPVED